MILKHRTICIAGFENREQRVRDILCTRVTLRQIGTKRVLTITGRICPLSHPRYLPSVDANDPSVVTCRVSD